ncbi:MAG: hypothetical protein J6U00_03290 [Ruminococcus sp.]|uniref:hypothetical protein n=1 Tax=Ruminococcus sp. TaxID=41978 RepID=UPI001B259F4E|nr:hypothetical protein [Ruminococcus sp.]MBO7473019.1 hypothetical protein [Ruminococcus sp.]
MASTEIHDITDYNYSGSKLKYFCHNWISGYFPEPERERTGFCMFSLTFQCKYQSKHVQPVFENPTPNKPAILEELTAEQCEDGVAVTLTVNGTTFSFVCDVINSSLKRYEGKSYRNIYDESIVPEISEEWFESEDSVTLADDLIMVRRHYCRKWFNAEGKMTGAHTYGKYRLLKNGAEVCSWVNVDDQAMPNGALIQHSNGRRYIGFHVDLYGISYVDPDSGEVYHYVPEGYSHDYRIECGESFIITNVHYDAASDLVAYGGCYWAGPDEVFAGDLRDPLHYDPHLVRLADIVEEMIGEEDEVDDINFVRWEPDALIVKMNKQEYVIPKRKLRSPF